MQFQISFPHQGECRALANEGAEAIEICVNVQSNVKQDTANIAIFLEKISFN